MLADVGPGDEVIMPSFTFVSTANAFVLRGAMPVFVDIRSDTLNLDEPQIEAAITPRTRAIVPVHYAGVACEMDVDHGDRRASWPAGHRGRGAGDHVDLSTAGRSARIGHLGALSFHETKNVICGRGRRAPHQRSDADRRAPRSSARRAPIAASSSAARWTSTPGSTSARLSCRARSSPRSCGRSWRRPIASPSVALQLWERYHDGVRVAGARRPRASPDRRRTVAATTPTCTTSCCATSTSELRSSST